MSSHLHNVDDHPTGEGILRDCGLKKTVGRVKILETLQSAGRALTGAELSDALGRDSMDPASIYRALDVFTRCGIVHKIEGADKVTRFALSRSAGSHPHFACRSCGRVDCLIDFALPCPSSASGGYIIEDQSVLFSGVCSHCNKKG